MHGQLGADGAGKNIDIDIDIGIGIGIGLAIIAEVAKRHGAAQRL